MGRSYQCFLLYKALLYRNNIDIHDRIVIETNNFIFKRHSDFFVPVRDSLLTKAIIDLYIFFDKDNNNYNYHDLLKELKLKCHHTIYDDTEKKIEDLFEQVKLEKKYLTNYRHADLAHDGKNKKSHKLSLEHIESLFSTTQQVFNLINHHLEDSFTDFDIYNENSAKDDINSLLRELNYGYEEFKRLLEVEEKNDLNYPR